jgi:hypothetical protein
VCSLCKTLIISVGLFVDFPDDDYIWLNICKNMMLKQPRYSNFTSDMIVLCYGSHGSFSGSTCLQLFRFPPDTLLGPPVYFCFGSETVKRIKRILLLRSFTLSKCK